MWSAYFEFDGGGLFSSNQPTIQPFYIQDGEDEPTRKQQKINKMRQYAEDVEFEEI